MIWSSLASFAVAAFICAGMLRKGADILSPGRVFGLTWSLVFGFASLKFSGLQSEWSFTDWACALMGPCSFLLGLFIAYAQNLGVPNLSVSEMRRIVKTQNVGTTTLFRLVIFSFILYLTGYAVIYMVKGYLPIFSKTPSASRIDYFVFGFGLFIYNMPIVILFSLIYHLYAKGELIKKWILNSCVAISITTYLFLLQRYQLMLISMVIFVVLYYSTRKIRARTVLAFAIVGIVVVYSISTLRVGQVVQLVLYKTSLMKFSYDYAIFTEPYMYLVMGIENFVRAIGKLDQHTFGYYTFDFALALSGLKHWMSDYFGIVETPYLNSGYNTYTLFWPFYRDFGFLGISLVTCAGGVFVGWIYHSMRQKPTIGLISTYAMLVFVMSLSFFLSPLGFLWFIYVLAWMGLVFRLIRVRASQDTRALHAT